MTQVTRRNMHEGLASLPVPHEPKHKGAPTHRHRWLHRFARRCKIKIRRYLFIASAVLGAHFVFHFSLYAYHELWVHQLGLPDPAALGESVASSGPVGLVIVMLAVAAVIQAILD